MCTEDICGKKDICPVRELVFKLGHEDCFDLCFPPPQRVLFSPLMISPCKARNWDTTGGCCLLFSLIRNIDSFLERRFSSSSAYPKPVPASP